LEAQTTLSNRPLLVAAGFALAALNMAVTSTSAQQPDTQTLVLHANKAANAYNQQQWREAKNDFRICIAERPTAVEFYEGLFNTCMKLGEWDQVTYALDKIFATDPSQKSIHAYEYGQALFHLNRYDEAIPYLKKALISADIPTVDYIPSNRPLLLARPLPPTSGGWGQEWQTGPLSYLYASTHSESICLAEFKGYAKSKEISWDHPAEAHYHITEALKGPDHGRALLVKYEFHDLVNVGMPKGWKFGEEMMPEKDSKWILFIEFAVPKRGMFELYQGSYGRLPATEENLNHVYSILDKYNLLNRHSKSYDEHEKHCDFSGGDYLKRMRG